MGPLRSAAVRPIIYLFPCTKTCTHANEGWFLKVVHSVFPNLFPFCRLQKLLEHPTYNNNLGKNYGLE